MLDTMIGTKKQERSSAHAVLDEMRHNVEIDGMAHTQLTVSYFLLARICPLNDRFPSALYLVDVRHVKTVQPSIDDRWIMKTWK